MRRFDLEANASENPANPFIIFPTADSTECARGTISLHPNITLSHSSLSLPLFLSLALSSLPAVLHFIYIMQRLGRKNSLSQT